MTVHIPKVFSIGSVCCGCGACAARCPKSCIAMERDGEGFFRPVADTSVCIGCGACDAVCPLLKVREEDRAESVFWARSEDDAERSLSSSGGVFALLAHDALSDGGIVVGAAWTPGCGAVRHTLVESEESLDSVMRSKYVQSSVGREVYEGVRAALIEGRRVLFAGTACQVAAMRAYLGSLAESEDFLSVDVICHGVPSPLLWERWVAFKERSAGATLRAVNMRSKTTGWLSYSASYAYAHDAEKDGVSVSPSPDLDSCVFYEDWYMKAFLANACLRPSCHSCSVKRACGSDITLGDFWGIQAAHSEVNYDGGISAVICNTDRGIQAFWEIKPYLSYGASSIDKILPGNPSLVRSVSPHPRRDEFMGDLGSGMTIANMMEKYDFEPTIGQKVRSKIGAIKGCLSKVIRRG